MSLAKQVSEKIGSIGERGAMLAFEAGPYKVHRERGGIGMEIENTKTGKSVFLQGDEAHQLEDELENAESKRGEQGLIDILSAYDEVMK